jgi:hypothetical protein
MGQERECKLRYGGKRQSGRALLETDYVLFRGETRLKLAFKDLTSVRASGGVLRLESSAGAAEFELGEAAEKWAHKILHPPSRLEKLGVKPGMKLRIVGQVETEFLRQVKAAGATTSGSESDLVFLCAEKNAELSHLAKIARELAPGAAIWVVYPKGVEEIREVEVIEAGRAAGLKDTKVTRFSDTHTALRFAPPRV